MKITYLSLRILFLLKEKWQSTNQLSEALHVCPRRVQQIMKDLRGEGYVFMEQYRKGHLHYHLDPSAATPLSGLLLPAEEKLLLQTLGRADKSLGNTLLKVIQKAVN